MSASDLITFGSVFVVVLVLLRKPLAQSVSQAINAIWKVSSSGQRLLLSRFFLALTPARSKWHWRIHVIYNLKDLGKTESALRDMNVLLDELPRDACPWSHVNTAVDLCVSAGLYRRALEVTELWSEAARVRGREQDEISCAITRINQAEALHNLGFDDAALARLDSVFDVAARNPLALNGLRCLRAWILVNRGALEAARGELGQIDPNALSDYRAEVSYTWAALERECGDQERALEHAESGLRLARSASSRRNGKLLLAELLVICGDEPRARDLFAEAASSTYRGQGGRGLLRYAKILGTRGDAGVETILELLLERDPESRFAVEARELLRERAPANAVRTA